MAELWSLYQRHPRFILGFHGTERATVDALVQRHTPHLDQSTSKNEWLGHGIYFWENDPQRALEWAQEGNAKKKIEEPDVVGAIIDLGLCLDLTTRVGLDEVARAYSALERSFNTFGAPLPSNSVGPDKLRRELDCAVIQALHLYRKDEKLVPYQSVRAPFPEAGELYDGAGFRARNHIQIAVIDSSCIKGYFRPIPA